MAEVNYTVRTITKEDVPQVLEVWRETGMQEATHCLYTWLAVDPEAFNIAVTDDGEVIGVCSACIHHEDLVFVGLYCVKEKYRGLGIGFKIWNACMDHVGSRNACLNAVPDKLELYRDRGGFPIVENDWVCRVYHTIEDVHPENLSNTPPPKVDIKPFQYYQLPLICDYDQKLMRYDRKQILELSCDEQDSRTLVAIKDGVCVGFGTIKMTCQEAGLVGPLYADDKDIAEVILRRLILALPQAKGFVMISVSCNEAANGFMERIGCPVAEDCPRLYRKQKVHVDFSKLFGHFDPNFSPY